MSTTTITRCLNCTEPTTDPAGMCRYCQDEINHDGAPATCDICSCHLTHDGRCETAGCPNDIYDGGAA